MCWPVASACLVFWNCSSPLIRKLIRIFVRVCAACCVLCVCVCVCVRAVCVYVGRMWASRLLITCGMMWHNIDLQYMKKFCYFYMEDVVSTFSWPGLRIEACSKNQPDKTKLALYKMLLHFMISCQERAL